MSKLVVVLGATGAQGASVVDHLLKAGGWKIRGVTRKPEGDPAKKLAAKGVEVVAADAADKESLAKAFQGAYAVFGVTNFYETTPEGEVQQGKNIVDAAKAAGVQHLVFSSLNNANKISGGKRKVPHFTTKGQIAEYMFQSGVPSTGVQPACYYENWTTWFAPKPNESGTLQFTTNLHSDSKFAVVSIAELGGVVAEVLAHKDKYVGKDIAIAGDYITPNEMAAQLTQSLGKEVKHCEVPEKVFAGFGFPFADELADMFGWFNDYGYYGEKTTKQDIWEGKSIYPHLSSFKQWLDAGKGPKV